MSEAVAIALIGTFVPTLTILLSYWRQSRKIKEVHKLVNSAHQAALQQIAELRLALSAIGNRASDNPEGKGIGQRATDQPEKALWATDDAPLPSPKIPPAAP